MKGQTSLSFGHTVQPSRSSHMPYPPVQSEIIEIESIDLTETHEPSPQPKMQLEVESEPPSPPLAPTARSTSPGPQHPPDNDEMFADSDEVEKEAEEWELEAEAETVLPKAIPEIRPWVVLREQIKDDLKKHSRTLPLSKINQLIILRNFATLQIKGYSKLAASQEIARQWHEGEGTHFARRVRALARFYQLNEQLPIEKRGGNKKARSLILDETVKFATRSWLMNQKPGTVTPHRFCEALNTQVLPSINVVLKQDLCIRTARRWLVRLGFRRTVLRKGVYKDGHDREDVKKYRDSVFLPEMAKHESRMTHYELDSEKLVPIKPVLNPGEREIIALFQDESCFHANDFMTSAWYVNHLFIQQQISRILQANEGPIHLTKKISRTLDPYLRLCQ